ncbi:MAG: VWA domain-containing protein [Gammaproteobacteria bacterium]|nr:VWA domain-containing protein [Gammaproteobacteria bacterium]
MIHLEWPAVLLLLPLPLLVRYLLPVSRADRMTALRTPFLHDFEVASGVLTPATGVWTVLLAVVAWTMLVLAAARPLWSGDPIRVPVAGRDLMLAVDLSVSMETADFRLEGRVVDRLTATKAVASRFIARREGDRLGLILFGRNAYVQAPLTFDRTTVERLLLEAAIGLAGEKTAIGDAIGLAVKRLQNNPASSRVLILMTDGANTAGAVEPTKAASLAAQAGLRIYTIGIGATGPRARSPIGVQQVNRSRHLDEEILKAVAARTGGQYFRAYNAADLERIYGVLDELEPVTDEGQPFRPTISLFMWPLGAALVLCFVLLIMRTGWRGST